MKIFQKLVDDVTFITVDNENGLEVTLCSFGASIYDLKTIDKNKKMESVVLYPTNLNDFYYSTGYFGKCVGRFSGRIDNARCTIAGKEYILDNNDNICSLHGGYDGISFQNFDYEIIGLNNCCKVIFRYDERANLLPGDVSYVFTYEIMKDKNEINLIFNATTNAETIVNLTNHAYFNLAGDGKETVMNQKLQFLCDRYTNLNNNLITISVDPVNEVFDFRNMHEIGLHINDESIQDHKAKGYDHCWLKEDESKDLIAVMYDDKSGRKLSVSTSYPAVVCYAGCYPAEFDFNEGFKIQKHHSICLECQYVPNGINMEDVDKAILRPGEIYNHFIKYTFEVEE